MKESDELSKRFYQGDGFEVQLLRSAFENGWSHCETKYESLLSSITEENAKLKKALDKTVHGRIQDLRNDQEHINDLNREIETLKAERDELKREVERLKEENTALLNLGELLVDEKDREINSLREALRRS